MIANYYRLQITYPEPSAAVLGLNLLAVANPVSVPTPKSTRVVNTDSVETLDFETSALELVDGPAKRSTSVRAGEDVLVHEKTPDKVLVLPRLAETSVLHVEDTIVIEHVVDLAQESRKVTNTDVLGHLQTGDLVVLARRDGNIAVVHAQDFALLLRNTGLAEAAVAPSSLVTSKSNTGSMRAVVDGGELGQSAPTAADVEHALTRLEADLLADNGHLVVLELLEGLFLLDVADDTAGVDHARAKEPAVEVVTSIVVVTNLLLVCIGQ